MYYKGRQITKTDYKVYTIDWMLGNYCNFNCVYCFDHANTGTHRPPVAWEDAQVMIKNVTHLINEMKNNMPEDGYLQMLFQGGEPTIYKHFPKLCKAINDVGVDNLLVVTNGSMPISWWKKHIDCFEDIQLSVHTAEANLEHTKNVIELFAQYPSKRCDASIIIGNHNFSKAVEWFNILKPIQEKRRMFSVRLATVRPTDRNIGYKPLTHQQLRIIKNLMIKSDKISSRLPASTPADRINIPDPQMKVRKKGWRTSNYARDELYISGNWLGYTCYGPIQFIAIDEEFNIDKMACRQKYYKEPLNVLDENFIEKFYMPKPVVCSIDAGKHCNCVGLYETNKRLLTK